jgi:uncharacterized membrane protein YfcA
MVAGVLGFGGGMLLIAILPMFLNPGLIIPIHGITQLASNSSRMIFSLEHVQWQLFPKFLVGSLIGIIVFGLILTNVSTEYVPIAIGVYILLNLWSQAFGNFIKKYESYYLIGLLQTGLGLIVGAPGPLALSVLTKNLRSKDEIIATSAMFMTISHLAKIPVFMALGVAVFGELNLLFFMVLGAILGSFAGTKLRLAAKNDGLIMMVKVLLSALALKMIVAVILPYIS